MSECKSCEAEIIWIKTEKGKNHPVNAEPIKMWVQNEDETWSIKDCYTSHFSSCPDADDHRQTVHGGDTSSDMFV